jgi:tetratricopeptide (TPR) repeat protein
VDDTPVRLNDAAEHYRWVLQRRPGNLQALLGMAVIRFEQGNRVESQQYMDGIAGSNAAFVHYVRGRLALGRGEDRDAKRAFLNCTKAAPYHLRGLYYLAETCFRLNALDESRAACEKVLELNPDFAPALFLLAECSLRGGRAAEAQKHLARYLADPQQLRQAGLPEGRFHSLAARVSYFQSDLVSALQFYEMASGSRADPALEFEIGCVHFAMQDYEQAAARFRHAQRAGHWPENLLDLTALTQLGQGQAGRALKSFERALETSPDDMLASLGAGALALQAGKTAVSQQHFQSAIEQYGNIKVLPGAGDRCLYKLVQLGLSIGSMIQPDELENNLQAVRKLVGIHYLQAMKMIVNIMIESGLSTAALLREYKGILNRVIGNMSFGQLA